MRPLTNRFGFARMVIRFGAGHYLAAAVGDAPTLMWPHGRGIGRHVR
jgi:hypothetical protein